MLHQVDFVIIGAGSAGCVLANKLSADGLRSVLVLEAGPADRNLMIHMPAGVYHAYRNPAINWNYKSEPQAGLHDRRIEAPRGRVLGGSSSINSMVYMRGHPFDYDRWASELGLTGWSYADCLPYFRAGEASDRGGNAWRGADGPLGVTRGHHDNPLYDAFLASGERAGQGTSDDLNGFDPEGVARFDTTTRNGRRCSAAVAHLHPAMGRPNLSVETGAMVEKIKMSGTEVTGLTYRRRGEVHRVEAGEVILCGGAINSPQTLMLSGIGPASHLREHGITPVLDAPAVGQNLMDHATVIMQWRCREPVTLDRMTNPLRQAAAGARWMVTRGGIVSSSIWEAGGLIRGNDRVAYPNLQYHMAPVGVETREGGTLHLLQAFAIHIDQLRPRSRGHLALRSANPTDKPALHFNYLSDAHDMQELIEGVHKVRDLVAQPTFDRWRGEELTIGEDAQSEEEIREGIRAHTETDYHPCGTCRMGVGEDAVVDAEFRVHGISNLRVVDASVMPRIVSANLNAPTQMIAARAADMILGKAQRAPEHASFAFQGAISSP